ncbi:MAG: hypothetical protein ACE5JI_21225 [Acidobacteriota bacterium]
MMRCRWIISNSLLAWVLLSVPAAAQQYASEKAVEELQAGLSNLEAELAHAQELDTTLPAGLAEGVEGIRNETIYLKVKMKKHRERGGEGTGVTVFEVEELHRRIAEVRADLQHARGAGEGTDRSGRLPVGTQFSVRLQNYLSTATAQEGDRFTATAIVPVTRHGDVLIPAGAELEGVVEMVDRVGGRTDRKARLLLAFNRVEIEGKSYGLVATVVGASEKMETGIGDEKKKMGVGAGIGAILGAVLGGKRGALAGLILGGSGAILATEGKDVELPRGTTLTLQLDRELILPRQ